MMEMFRNPYPHEYDVVVAGGGPAGIAAAVSAARTGAKTALIERYGILGGMLTSGHVQPILGHAQGRTMYDEIVELLAAGHEDAPKMVTRNGKEIGFDLEEAKYRLLKLCVDNGVYVYLQTVVADVLKEESLVTGVKICTPMGLQELKAKVVVDSTGDGFVAALAGAPFEMGRELDGKCQPVTLEFTVDNVDESVGITAWGGSDPVTLPDGTKYSEACKAANARGELPENVTIVRLHRTANAGERNVNATQVNGRNSLTVEGIVESELLLRQQVQPIMDFLRKTAPGFANARVKSSASTLGVRETRCFVGEYVLSDSDVEIGSRFEDVVVHKAWFLIDIHNPAGGGQAEKRSQPATPYDIPYRSLVPLEIDGLLLSGRNISGTHRAHASYRVMGVAMATGQAAGMAAALCAQEGCVPRQLDYRKVQQCLTCYGAQLFHEDEK